MAADDPTIGDALHEHLRAQGLPPDCGVSQRWVRVRMLGLPVVFPNFDARRAVLVTHDVHHLLTGYPTTWHGEGEIGAFEIASGCRGFWAAWFFNFGGFLFGLAIAPAATFRAYVRGRRCRNFYGEPVAAELGLDRPGPRGNARDVAGFVAWGAAIVLAYAGLPVAVVSLLW
jgi:hypothetical protein